MFENGETVVSPSGARLLLRHQPARARARGVVLVIHGLAEHSARYARLAGDLSSHGFHVFAHDHRGHGGTRAADAPPRRFAGREGWRAVLLDCEAVESEARRRGPNLPIVVLGHSMGALIAANLAARRGGALAGAALWNADLASGGPARLGRVALRVERAVRGSDVSSALFATLTFEAWAKSIPGRRTEADWLSHDAAQIDAYVADPLCGWRPSVSMADDILRLSIEGGSRRTLTEIPKTMPLHLLGGSRDPATANGRATRRLAARLLSVGHRQVTTAIIEDARHETLNEIEAYRRPAMESLTAWLDRIAPRRA